MRVGTWPDAALAAALVAGVACGGSAIGTAPATTEITFAATVHPILVRSCRPCHANDLALATAAAAYPNVVRFVSTASPSQSALLLAGTGQVPHAGGVQLTPQDAELILRWIEAGAKDD